MKAFLAALCAAAIIAIGMNFILKEMEFSAQTATTGPNARVEQGG